MRAINLIPADQRRGAGGIAGRSGGVMYVLVGALVVIVALGVVYAFAVKSVADRKGQLASVTAQVGQVEQEANALQPYQAVAQLRQRAVASAVSLAESRFDWPDAMRQLVLALPSDVTLTSMNGSVSTAGSASGGTASTAGPTFSVAGCASSQAEVATVLTRLGEVPGVTNVTLEGSAKTTGSAPNASKPVKRTKAEAVSGSCPLVSFDLSLGYDSSYTLSPKHAPVADEPAASAGTGTGVTASTSSSGE